jgi:hypothetical protein
MTCISVSGISLKVALNTNNPNPPLYRIGLFCQ